MANILITGGSGLIGSRLSELLRDKGHDVSWLSRSKKNNIAGFRSYHWNVDEEIIDEEALRSADHIIHLAGTNLAEKRWTPKRKKELYNSRVLSALLIRKKLQEIPHKVQTFISASAVGFYGDSGDKWLKETDTPGNDFLAKLCKDWEEQALRFEQKNIRTIIFRNGVVLSKKGGALPEMTKTMPFGVLGYLGDGKQFYSWIHLDDICNIYIHALERKDMSGIFNAVTPAPITHHELMQEIKEATNSSALLMPVPEMALRIGVGEITDSLLASLRCSSEKIQNTGFSFQFPDVKSALFNIYRK